MAMTPLGLKSFIITELQNQGFAPLNPATGGEAERYIEALATAIVTYIQQNAEVTTNVAGGSSSGSHPGTIS